MVGTLVQLLATAKRPGWQWNPWRGVLEHPGLRLAISIGTLKEQAVADQASLQSLLSAKEEHAGLKTHRPTSAARSTSCSRRKRSMNARSASVHRG